MNKLFANTRDSFATVEKNAAGKKRSVSATTLARAIYCFAAASTIEAATAHYAIVQVLLTHCVTVSDQKDDFLRFIAVDVGQMASKTREARDASNTSPHAPLKCRVLLAKLLLEADPTWLVEKASIIETLQAFIVFRKPEFSCPLLDDAKHMAMLDSEDALALRAYAEKVGSKLAAEVMGRFSPHPRRPEPCSLGACRASMYK